MMEVCSKRFGAVNLVNKFVSVVNFFWGPVELLVYVASMLFNIVKNKKLCTLFFVNCFSTSALAKQADILIFGGNGFIGSECVKTLLKDGHKITVVNRGNNYWDYSTLIKPYVTEVQCNRDEGLDNCLLKYKHRQVFDFVIDFSAFRANEIQDAFLHLEGKIGTYIYISSDSVYEVSKVSRNKFLKETDAVRPMDPNEKRTLNRKDSYGHNKLAGEEWLDGQSFASRGIPFVIFRLPDVIGPRDRTYRWWTYQTWMQVYSSSGKPLFLPRTTLSLATSYVYVKDVARMISKTVSEVSNGNRSSVNERFNIAFPEEYSLKKLLDSMQEALGVKGVEYRYIDKAHRLLPSVTRGPIDISKATKVLQFAATPWHQAVQETVNFFEDALYKFQDDRHAMIHDLSHLVGETAESVEQKVNHYLKFTSAESSRKCNLMSKSHDEL